jgi:ABC-type sugar transport system permease subunit
MSGVPPTGPTGPTGPPGFTGPPGQQPWLGGPPPARPQAPYPQQPYPGYGPPPVRPAASGGGVPGWVGLLLALPFLVGWIYWLAVPTVQTVAMSFQSVSFERPGVGVGLRNYSALGDAGFWGALGHTVALAVVPVLVIGLVAPLLAFAVNRGSSGIRMAARLVLTIPLAGFAPAVVVVAWRMLLAKPDGALSGVLGFTSDLSTSVTMQVVTALATLGLLVGIGVAVYLAALRSRGDQDAAPPLPAGQGVRRIGAVWALVVIGTLAFGLQSITLTLGLTAGGRNTATAELNLYQVSFQRFQFGLGAAGGTVLLVPLFLLGTAAGLVVVLSRMRIELEPRRAAGAFGGAVRRRPGAAVGVVGLVAAVVVALVDLLPRLGVFGGHQASSPSYPVGSVLVNTLVPPLLATLVLVPLAYLGGLGIGGLRPLGRRSEWLLMIFAPWLFVLAGPLSAALYRSAVADHSVDTLLGLVPPIVASVPALFVFTLFSAGRSRVWQALPVGQRDFGALVRVLVVPALPLIGLVALVSWLLGAADVYWPMLMGNGTKHTSGPVLLYESLFQAQYPGAGVPFSLVLLATPVSVLALVGLVALQLTYLHRLAIRTGTDTSAVPTTGSAAPTAPVPYPTDPSTVRLPTPPPPSGPRPLAPGPGPTFPSGPGPVAPGAGVAPPGSGQVPPGAMPPRPGGYPPPGYPQPPYGQPPSGHPPTPPGQMPPGTGWLPPDQIPAPPSSAPPGSGGRDPADPAPSDRTQRIERPDEPSDRTQRIERPDGSGENGTPGR